MPIEVEKNVETTSSGPLSDQVSQTSSTARVATEGEAQDAKVDRNNAWVWYIVSIVDLLLFLRLLFKLFGAQSVGFADGLYNLTSPLVAPFRGIFPNLPLEGSYFDVASLTAIVAYALLGWIVVRLIDLVARPANSPQV
jgi:uncharacterized protein YggT (Ycf19 family)